MTPLKKVLILGALGACSLPTQAAFHEGAIGERSAPVGLHHRTPAPMAQNPDVLKKKSPWKSDRDGDNNSGSRKKPRVQSSIKQPAPKPPAVTSPPRPPPNSPEPTDPMDVDKKSLPSSRKKRPFLNLEDFGDVFAIYDKKGYQGLFQIGRPFSRE